MPRDGSGIMSWPANGNAVTATAIDSNKYNARFADLLADLNAARPITAGGTGAITAIGGNDALNTTGANIASAATTDLSTATGVVVVVTGSVAIAAFGVLPSGVCRTLIFSGAPLLTYNAVSLILPGAASIQAASGDVAVMRSLGSGNWVCISYQRANGQPVSSTLSSPTVVTPILTLKQSATPAPTVSGDIQFGTTNKVLAVGNGATTTTFVPIPASTAAGDIEYYTAAQIKARLAKGTALQVLRMNAAATAPEWGDRITLGTTVATTSGTSFDFTGIPATAKRLTVNISGLSTSGSSLPILRIGPVGGVETSGYLGNTGAAVGGVNTGWASGVLLSPATGASDVIHDVVTFTLLDPATNTWSVSVCGAFSSAGFAIIGGGTKPLAGVLSVVRLTTVNGTDTFDAGKANVMWE